MCIIITKERGHAAPSWNRIEASTDNNPDGFCFLYSKAKGETPEVIRMLDRKSFLAKIKPLMDNEEANWILHARIMSVGKICLENVHGWHDESTGLYFTHNGTLSIRAADGLTDSETAFRNLLVPAALINRKFLLEAARTIIGTSKFAMMTKDGEIIRLGNYEEEDGVCYSNSSYKYSSYLPSASKYSYGGYGSSQKDWEKYWGKGNFGYEDEYVDEVDTIGSTKYTKNNNVFLPKTENVTKTKASTTTKKSNKK